MSNIYEGMYKAQVLTETRTYKLWESAGQKIVEAQLTADQINQLFANIEQGATAAGGNRTMIGKGKDVATAVNKAWEDLKTKASNSGPIKNMDAMYDQAAEKLKQATGGDQGVMKYVQKYRDFAKKHPVAQSLIYGALIAAAGITGAGVGGAAALGLFKMVDKLLQGEKFSSAAYQGAKTGALAYGASKLGDLVTGRNTPVTAKSSKTTWDAVDQGFAKPQGAGGGLSGGGTTSGSDTWSATLRGVTGDQIRNHPDYATYIQRYGDTVNGRRMAQMAVKNAMARAQSNESVELNEATISVLFTRIDEGLWDTIKGKAQQIGKNLTTKVTADKLMKMWKAEGSPTDSNQLMFFLTQKAGVDKAVADKVFADMKIKTKTAKPAANKGLQSKPGINPATGKPFAPKVAAQPAAPAAGAKSSVPQGGGRVKGAGLSQTPNAIKKRQQRMTAKTTAQPKPAAAPAAQPAANTAAAKPTAQPASTGSGLNYYNTVRNMRRRGMAVGEDQGSDEFQHKISNIVRQNPKGSASEKMILNRFLATPMVQDFNLKGQEWIDQAHEWLQTVKKDLQKKYPDADLSDLEELAHKMYEDYLARIGQLEEAEIEKINPNDNFNINDIHDLEKINDLESLKKKAKYLIKGKPIRRMKPEKIAYFYDRVDTLSSRMKVIKLMYDLLLAGEGLKTIGSQYSMDPNLYAKRFNEDDVEEGYSAGASGGAGLGEDTAYAGGMGQGGNAGQSYRKFRPKAAGSKSSGIMEGLLQEYDTKTIDSVVQRLPKGLTVNNFTSPAFKEFLYQKYYTPMKAGWDKLWPFFSKEYKEKHGIKEYKQNPYQILSGDSDFFDNMLMVIPKGLGTSELYTQAFKEFLYNKFGDKEWTDFKKNRFTYWDAYEKMGGSKPQGMFNKLKSKIGLEEEQLDEDAVVDQFYDEFLSSNFNPNSPSYLDTLKGIKGFLSHKNLPNDKLKFVLKKLIQKVKPELEEEQVHELKCWAGYKRVPGTKAGEKGSCTKAESAIMKGIQSEDQVDEYKEIEGQRKIEFSKENPPDLYYLYQQFIQRMLNPENTIDPYEWIDKVNKHYGLNYSWKDYQKRGHNDHTDNWQKIINKYILKKQ